MRKWQLDFLVGEQKPSENGGSSSVGCHEIANSWKKGESVQCSLWEQLGR